MLSKISVEEEQAIKYLEKNVSDAIDTARRTIENNNCDEIDDAIAKSNLRLANLNLIAFLERYSDKTPSLLDEAKRLSVEFGNDPLKCEVLNGEAFGIYPWRLQEVLDILKSIYLPGDQSPPDLARLENILNSADGFVTNTKIFNKAPDSEQELHCRLEALLKCYYSDLIPKPRLPRPIKSFEPDSGIPSLRTLLEYKYIEKVDDGKAIIDQILADMSGYKCADYDNIIFVIYETNRIFSQYDWDRAISECKPSMNIKIIVLKGVPAKLAEDKVNSRVTKPKIRAGVSKKD